jgi:hypothetical protein
MSFSRHTPPFLSDACIIAFIDGVDTQYSASILKTSFAPNAQGKYTIPAGMFVAETGGERHLLKRASITQAFATTEGFIDHWQLFAVGDVLQIVEPYLRLAITTLAVNQTVTFEVDDQSEVFTFAGTIGATPADAAAEIASWITNDSYIFSNYVTAIALNANVHLYAKDGFTRHTISATTAGTVTPNFGDGKMRINQVFGTIASIDNLLAPGKVTLTSSATHPLPIGSHLGTPCGRVMGFINNSIDLTYKERDHYALVSGARGVYEGKLPYIDGDIKRQLSDIHFGTRF